MHYARFGRVRSIDYCEDVFSIWGGQARNRVLGANRNSSRNSLLQSFSLLAIMKAQIEKEEPPPQPSPSLAAAALLVLYPRVS